LEKVGGKELKISDVVVRGEDEIHAITNPQQVVGQFGNLAPIISRT
jgi:hypothetical protein